MIMIVTVGVLITIILFLLVIFVSLLTLIADTKSVALGIATTTVTVAGKFVFTILNELTSNHINEKVVALNFILLALIMTVGLLALTVAFFIDRKFKK